MRNKPKPKSKDMRKFVITTPWWWRPRVHPIMSWADTAVLLKKLNKNAKITWNIMGYSINGKHADVYYVEKKWKIPE